MKITKRRIYHLIEGANTLQGLQEVYADAPVALAYPRDPASAKQLAALRAHLRRVDVPLPATYGTFLSLCNGIPHFAPGPYDSLSLLGVEELMEAPNKAHASRARMFPELSRFQIGRGDTRAFIAFDPGTASKSGEMEIAWITAEGEETRYPDFASFVDRRLEILRAQIKIAEGAAKKRWKA